MAVKHLPVHGIASQLGNVTLSASPVPYLNTDDVN